MAKGEHQLNAGSPAFHLQQDLVTWKVEKIPSRIAEIAEETGFLTIMGYRCTVFKTPEGDQWAQKSVNVPADPPKKEKPEKPEKDSDKESDEDSDEDSEDLADKKSSPAKPKSEPKLKPSSVDEDIEEPLDFSLSDEPGSADSSNEKSESEVPAPKKPEPKKSTKKPEILDVDSPSEEPASDSDGGSQIASSNRMMRRVALLLARL